MKKECDCDHNEFCETCTPKPSREQQLEALLREAYGHIAEGSASDLSRFNILQRIGFALGFDKTAREVAARIEGLQNWAEAK